MIRAKNNKLAETIFKPYINWLFKRHFSSFSSTLFNESRADAKGIIITPNHFSWWDGFFIYFFIKKHFPKREIKMMMLEEQLSRFWFFRYLGCFSVNPGNPKSIIESLKYAVQQVNEDNVLVIYPQGSIQPFYAPFHAKNGVQHLIEKAPEDTLVIPAIFVIDYAEMRLPGVRAIGSVIASADLRRKGISQLEYEMTLIREKLLRNSIHALET